MYKLCVKRILDFLIALVASPVAIIVIFIAAPFIYINDPGPILYNAKGLGYKGKNLRCIN